MDPANEDLIMDVGFVVSCTAAGTPKSVEFESRPGYRWKAKGRSCGDNLACYPIIMVRAV